MRRPDLLLGLACAMAAPLAAGAQQKPLVVPPVLLAQADEVIE
jgi:hypothetical protein